MAKKPPWWSTVIRLAVAVEGRTEEEFIKRVLQPHMLDREIHMQPILIGKSGGGRGGNAEIQRIVNDISKLSYNFDAVTTLVDYYGFRKRGDISVEQLEEKIRQMAFKKIRSDVSQHKLFPYVQKYEFEGLLFSDVDVFDELPDATPDLLQRLNDVRNRFETPEDINDSRDTAPSKRISSVFPRYQKSVDGPDLIDSIGLSVLQRECPRFNSWIKRIEGLSKSVDQL